MIYPLIKIVSKQGCVNCDKVKELITSHGHKYKEISDKTCVKFPKCYIGNTEIGDYTAVSTNLSKGMRMDMFKPNIAYKPFKYSWAVDLRDRHETVHWIEREINMADDVNDWKSSVVTDVEKAHITAILRLFTEMDVSVGGLYYDNFIRVFKNNEIRNMMGSFACREGTHQKAYALLLDTLGMAESEYSTFKNYVEMTDKMDFMNEMNVDSLNGLARALIKAIFNEGVALFSAFAMLISYQRFGKMKGMGKVVEWSIRDENMHVEGLCGIFKELCKEYPFVINNKFHKDVKKINDTTISLEDKFVDLAFEAGPIQGLTAEQTKQYIRYVAEARLVQAGLKETVVTENPIKWVSWLIDGKDHTNFFENTVAEYEVGGLEGEWVYDVIDKVELVSCPDGKCERVEDAKEQPMCAGGVCFLNPTFRDIIPGDDSYYYEPIPTNELDDYDCSQALLSKNEPEENDECDYVNEPKENDEQANAVKRLAQIKHVLVDLETFCSTESDYMIDMAQTLSTLINTL